MKWFGKSGIDRSFSWSVIIWTKKQGKDTTIHRSTIYKNPYTGTVNYIAGLEWAIPDVRKLRMRGSKSFL